jgi:amidase
MAPLGDFGGGLATELVVSHSVRDTAAVLEWASEGAPPGEPYFPPPKARPYTDEVGADPGKLRIGLLTSPPGGLPASHPDCVAAAESAARTLESLGHSVEVSHPTALDDEGYIPQFLVRWTAGVAAGLDFWGIRTGKPVTAEDVEPCTWALAEQGWSNSAAAYLTAIGYAQIVSRAVLSWWQDFDLLLTPTMAQPPAEIGSIGTGRDDESPLAPIERSIPYAAFTAAFNATGQPAISLPLHWSEAGLPIGVQLVGDLGREDLLLQVASQLEQAAPWAERRPELSAAA